MSDDENRKHARKIKANGEATAIEEARANANLTRSGASLASILERCIEHKVYAETYKMNYRGTLRGIVLNGVGDVISLLMFPLWRTGDWGDQPNETFEEQMQASADFPRIIAWESITDFGLQQSHWKDGPSIGPRSASAD